MNLDKIHQYRLWWAKEDHSILPANLTNHKDMPPVSDYPYAYCRFPLQIKTEIYRRRADGGYGSDDRLAVFSATANESLVLAMATGGRRYPWWRILRPPRPTTIRLSDALIIASESCERCLNALAYRYGLDWGYPEYGDQWQACGTRCPMCEDDDDQIC